MACCMQLLDAIFYADRGSLSETVDSDAMQTATGVSSLEILDRIAADVVAGYSEHVLQRNPHLVLLDQKFYRERLQPSLVLWTLGWLRPRFVGECTVRRQTLIEYITGADFDVCRDEVNSGLCGDRNS